MLLKNIKINTLAVFLLSVVFICFFFYSKHDIQLSEVNVFNVDPYDAIGSSAIQLALIAATFSMMRLSILTIIELLLDYQVRMILRGNLVSLLSIGVTMIADIIALIRYSKIWINSSSGILLAAMVISLLLITVILICWTLKLAVRKKLNVEYRLFSLKNLWSLAGIIIIAFYPVAFPFQKSFIWAIFTAYLGMAIQIMIVKNLAFLIFQSEETAGPDLISVMSELYLRIKSHLNFFRPFLDNTENRLKKGKAKALINWLNPRKYKWNLIILIIIFLGIALAFLEAVGDEWIGFNMKALMLFSVYLGGESVIILLFYGIFGNYLGIVNTEKDIRSDV